MFLRPSIVHRAAYTGNNIVGRNSLRNDPSDLAYDWRKYLPVESWICSCTQARNPSFQLNEGISKIQTYQPLSNVFLTDIIKTEEWNSLIFGDSMNLKTDWPLIKIVDIGGKPIQLFSEFTDMNDKSYENPSVPCHFHPQKSEALFYPIMPQFGKDAIAMSANASDTEQTEPKNMELKHVTRLGIKPETKKQDFIDAIETGFGKNHSVYKYLNEYDIKLNTGWFIPNGIVHSPGPRLTLQVQTPSDDYHLLSWQMGQHFDSSDSKQESKRLKKMKSHCLRFKSTVESVVDGIDWTNSTDDKFVENYQRIPKLIESGDWGERKQIFFDLFYAEMVTIKPQRRYFYEKIKNRPVCAVVWQGNGYMGIEDNFVSAMNPMRREFVICQNIIDMEMVNTSDSANIMLFLFYPLKCGM